MKNYDETLQLLGKKHAEAKLLLMANRLHKELADKPLEQVLAEHLPATAPDKRRTAAENIHRGVEQFYSSLDEQVGADWRKEHLNRPLDGRSCDEKCRYLIQLLDCAGAVQPDQAQGPRLEQLRAAERFQESDVEELLDMVSQRIENNAGFAARREFLVMEEALGKLPDSVVQAQMNSGPAYAEAYAAAMYITAEQSSEATELLPYQMGLLAATSVEKSNLLAQYHYGKLRLKALIAKLKEMIERMLTFAGEMLLFDLALGVRVYAGYSAGACIFNMLTTLSVTNTFVLFLIPFGFAVWGFLTWSQEEMMENLSSFWQSAKNLFAKVVAFFRGETVSSAPVEAVQTVTIEESQAFVYVQSDSNCVTV